MRKTLCSKLLSEAEVSKMGRSLGGISKHLLIPEIISSNNCFEVQVIHICNHFAEVWKKTQTVTTRWEEIGWDVQEQPRKHQGLMTFNNCNNCLGIADIFISVFPHYPQELNRTEHAFELLNV